MNINKLQTLIDAKKRTNKIIKTIRGFTLIELVVILMILTILASISTPYFVGYINNAKERVCINNRLQVEKLYKAHIDLYNIENPVDNFLLFLEENYGEVICPDGGTIDYGNEKVQCDHHPLKDNSREEDDDGVVPYL